MLHEKFKATDVFSNRHIGPDDNEIREMLSTLGFSSLDELVSATVPKSIRLKDKLNLPEAMSEYEVLEELRAISLQNKIFRSYIGMGYNDCVTPPVILRNIMENPGWYTQYTPYQAEIAQGRLEALLNFQTMITDLTKMEIANASMLDEATAAAEAMSLCYNNYSHGKDVTVKTFFISQLCHPQTIEVVKTRAHALGLETIVGDHRSLKQKVFGALLQYPASDGAIYDYSDFINELHKTKAFAVVATDLLSLALLKTPGEFGADVVVGNSQRFGVPLGYGGPHAAFFATREEFKRTMPGRLVGVSVDAQGKPALRLALQTREQHIRRAKATSNICTAQVLLGVMASMYAVYHGPEGIRKIAQRVHNFTKALGGALKSLGFEVEHKVFFDTLRVKLKDNEQFQIVWDRCQTEKINFRTIDERTLGISFDETTSLNDLLDVLKVFTGKDSSDYPLDNFVEEFSLPETFKRQSDYLKHPVFNSYHSETEMLRYMAKLQSKDLSLAVSMIPLGSCTMKLNAAAEMIPVTWPEFSKIHPFVPLDQAEGYRIVHEKLEMWLCEITGFDGISLQPNAGSQGEYAGLLVIKKYHQATGQGHRDVCLIPNSAHGTNPASAVMAGLKVVGVETDSNGNISMTDLKEKAHLHKDKLAALMITYPSTHGVFEETITEICNLVHENGGQVYLDGANMNAQVGLCRPGDFGADVCHLNLHKTFCIPHGGGGPGMGPIGVGKHLVPFLPNHPVVPMPHATEKSIGPVSAAPWGSPSILPISYIYVLMMGEPGLKKATQVAILNANYMAKKLGTDYPVLYKGREGLVAHECIIDLRELKLKSGIEVDDIAKRLMDYGFHAPTVSWPVAGTMMVEPTESESKKELDRFCEAMIFIRQEVRQIEDGKADKTINVLKGAPHTAQVVISDKWDRPYSRDQAAFPAPWTREFKFWPAVSRIDNPYGDRNLFCSCPPVGEDSSAGR
jgi:glycine dehydrogenase